MFETFDHTADIGLRIRAADLDGLFADAARGLFSIMVENPDRIEPRTSVGVSLAAGNLEDLFFDWLAELLYTFDTRHLLLSQFDVNVENSSLRADCRGEAIDLRRHQLIREVKAITYHELSVKRVNEGWQAQVIVDI